MKRLFRITEIISRIIVGFVFLFSGFVKAVDPLGSTYKFIDYFYAFKLPWLEPTAFILSIILSSLEFTIGFCLLLFIQNRLANWGALLFMIVFTPLTLWLAISDPVQDCGCFGDAIILTNWQTFYKNVIIIALTILSFICRNSIIRWVKYKTEWTVTLIIVLLISGFSWYNYRHLPVIDFRPYKIGTYIPDKMVIPEGALADQYEQYFTLVDTVTGEEKIIEIARYTADSTYWFKGTTWKFISAGEPELIKKGYEPPIHDFTIVSLEGDDITEYVLSDSGYYFLLVAYDLKKSKIKNQLKITNLHKKAISNGYKFIGLTSVTTDEILKFKTSHNVPYDFYITDPITLKTIVRANPGLVLLHKGTILAKWHSNDIPDFKNIQENYIKE